MSEYLNIISAVWPFVLTIGTVLWLFFASPFAWWTSGLVSKRLFVRSFLFLLFWIAIVIFKLQLLIRLLFRGIPPWKQWHAWRMFEKLTRCFIQGKKDTLLFCAMTMILCVDESKEKSEDITVDIDEVVNSAERGCVCPVSLTRVLRIIFCLTDGDREYLQSFFLLMKRNPCRAFWHGAFNALMDAAQKWDLIKARKNIFVVGNVIADKILEFACVDGEKELAEGVVKIRQRLRDLELSDVKYVGEKVICEMVDELSTEINDVGAKLYVVCKIKKQAEVKPIDSNLLEVGNGTT